MDEYNKARIDAMERQLKLDELFADYIQEVDYYLYNEAYEYANNKDKIC